jgi:hypothetical protein
LIGGRGLLAGSPGDRRGGLRWSVLAVAAVAARALVVPIRPTRGTDHSPSVRWTAYRVNNGVTMARMIYQLRITLQEVSPPIWRRVLLPGGYTLDRVHRVIQFAMGWSNYHLHVFDIDGVQYGMPDPDELLPVRDELDVRLDAVAAKGARLRYTYDFGDWWEHEVLVEDVLPADPEMFYPTCIGGERACPPEDVGGPYGYEELLVALADPRHPEHEALREWLGRPFDPEAFDPERATTLLRRMT